MGDESTKSLYEIIGPSIVACSCHAYPFHYKSATMRLSHVVCTAQEREEVWGVKAMFLFRLPVGCSRHVLDPIATGLAAICLNLPQPPPSPAPPVSFASLCVVRLGKGFLLPTLPPFLPREFPHYCLQMRCWHPFRYLCP